MPQPVKLLATTLTILTCTAGAALAEIPTAATAGPIATAAHRHSHRLHRGLCARRRAAAAHCTSTRKNRARKQLKIHPAARSHRPRTTAPSSTAAHAIATRQSAAIAQALAAQCVNTELIPVGGNIPLVRAAVLCLINRERAQNGVPPLTLSPQLETAAEGHCSELIAEDYFAHIAPSGETPVDRVRATGYIPGPAAGYVIGENLAWGTYSLATPQSIVSAWTASPEHLANILEAKYTDTGIGITPAVPASLSGGAPGATYAQEFGVIIH